MPKLNRCRVIRLSAFGLVIMALATPSSIEAHTENNDARFAEKLRFVHDSLRRGDIEFNFSVPGTEMSESETKVSQSDWRQTFRQWKDTKGTPG